MVEELAVTCSLVIDVNFEASFFFFFFIKIRRYGTCILGYSSTSTTFKVVLLDLHATAVHVDCTCMYVMYIYYVYMYTCM